MDLNNCEYGFIMGFPENNTEKIMSIPQSWTLVIGDGQYLSNLPGLQNIYDYIKDNPDIDMVSVGYHTNENILDFHLNDSFNEYLYQGLGDKSYAYFIRTINLQKIIKNTFPVEAGKVYTSKEILVTRDPCYSQYQNWPRLYGLLLIVFALTILTLFQDDPFAFVVSPGYIFRPISAFAFLFVVVGLALLIL